MMAAMTLPNKIASYAEIKAVKKAAASMVPETEPEKRKQVGPGRGRPRQGPDARDDPRRGKRLDGRAFDQIRPITCEVGLLPRTHGSALFTRGETQALVTATLGTSDDAQIIEEYEGESEHTFLLHYNFPPFSVGETKFMRGPSRRDIGHGNLARRSLSPVLPNEDAFPYTVRVVSDILESNGSSSMATVCGGTLALMDAGRSDQGADRRGRDGPRLRRGPVRDPDRHRRPGRPLRRHGLQGRRLARRDHGPPDGHQDQGAAPRDPRAGARRRPAPAGSTSSSGWPRRSTQPRPNISPYAPRIFTIQIPRDRIRDVIGSGGKTIRSIIESTGCKIDVEDSGQGLDRLLRRGGGAAGDRDHRGPDPGAGDRQGLPGKVRRVEPYGAFVEILPGQDGLVHISELAPYRVRQTTDVVKEGDEVTVKIIAVDPMGKIKLSRKQALSKEELDAGDGAGARGRRRGRGPGRVPAGRARPGRAPRPSQPGAGGPRGPRAE